MSEIKPVSIKTAEQRINEKYRDFSGMAGDEVWLDANEAEAAELRAALEALQAENAKLQSRYSALHQQKLELRSEIDIIYEPEIKNLKAENAAQAKHIAMLEAAKPKMAPVQGYVQGIPWDMHLEAYNAYCKKYGAQHALIEGGCRGGFGVGELDMFIPGWREKLSLVGKLNAEIEALRKRCIEISEVHALQIKMLEHQNRTLLDQLTKADLFAPRTYVIQMPEGSTILESAQKGTE